jgi:hypothetical protein
VFVHHLLLDANRPSQIVDIFREAGLISAEMLHEVGQAIRERIEFLVDRFLCTVLRVLEESDHEEGDDGRRRVDHELPRVDARKQPERRCPQHNQQDARNEERRATYEAGGRLREAIEELTFCSVISSPCTLSSFYLSSMLATIAVARFRGSRLPCEADRGALAPVA